MSNIKNTVPKKEKCFDLKKIEDFLIETCSKLLNNKKISIEEKFFDMGMNSLMLTKLVGNINSVYDIKLDVVDLFLYVNIKSLSDYICNGIEKDSSSITVNEDIKSDDNKYIAIIGMAAKLPGSKDIYEFWENLKRGKDTITRFTDEELIESGIDEKVIKSPNYVKAKGIIEDELSFDYSFFGYSPYEAKNMDPQMRILHEYVWAALEDAGYRTSDYEGLIGCFVGSGSNYNWNVNAYREPCDLSEQIEKILLTEKDYFATRMAYKLDFRGPSYAVQSACSSSLSGVNVACKSLLSNECDIGVVAGVSVSLPVNSGYMYNEGSMLSKDGKCKVFDNNATGTIFSDGIGVVVLKRLDDAIRDGDNIYAVIKGIASNNDGNRRSGYTAPSIEGQRDVILAAQKAAQVEADTVSYIEAHGTGTLLGDPIEIKGLKSVFKSNKENTCAIGSVKANIGHLNSTSGVASLIKTALAIKNKQIPPQINFDNLNDKIDFKNTPFYINTELSKWNNLKDSQGNEIPLRAGISSFGFGGTNVHAILEEVKKNHNAEDYEQTRESYLLVLSAKNVKSLDSITRKMYEYLNKNPEVNLWNIVRTLQSGREEFNLRKAYEVSNLGEIKDLMLEDIQGRSCNKLISGVNNKENLVFMFTGQGSQYIDMGLELYQKEKYFRDEMDKCFKILDNFVSYNLKEILYPKTNKEINMEKLKETNKTQLAVFIFEYSLARLLMKWGIQPDIMIGHSLGEYVAACLSGVFSLEDAIKVLIKRGELMSKIPRGIMISLNLNYIEAKELMKGFKLTLSVVNSESSCVVSGDNENIKRFQELLDIKGIEGKVLRTSHAFHSHMMDPILNEFENYFDEIRFGKVNIPYISNLTGQEIKNEEATSGEYWKRHLRETVRFDKGINNLMGTDNNVFIEIGPGNALTSLAKKAKNSENQVIINVIRHQKEDISDVKYLNRSIGRAWCSGVRINWSEYNNKAKYNKVSLPTYQFVRNIFKYNNNFDMKYLKLNSNDSIDDDEFQEDKTEFYLRSNYVEPKTEIEKQVASIWREILGVKIISIKDSFFELGGESLYAAKIVNRIKERLNIVVPINMLFEYKTIEEFSKYISSLDKNKVISMEKSEEREYYLASSQEKRMYLQQMSDKDSSLLNVTGVLEVKGKLNVENVDNAFKEIIKRHEALRSSFGIKDGQVVQKVLAADKVNFKVNKVECNKEENLNNIIKNLIKPFDLEKGKLINVSVIKRKDDLWILIIDVHHIATDMTSMKIIYNEFGKLYSGELLKDVLYQYKDYSKWQIDEHKKENYKKQEEYWLKEFEGNLPTMDLKAANKRSAVRDYKGKLAILKIDEKKTKKLKSLAQEEDSTLYMVLLACMNIFLYKYSGEKDIIIGTPIAGRSQPDLENIVGMFINTVCIRTIINESKSFKEYLEKVKVKTIRAFENQDYQFDEVISKLKIKREPGRNPLFDIMFVLQEMPKIQIKNLEFIEYEFEKNQEMFDMSFVAREENGEITFYVTYAEGLFDSNFVQDMLERYESIIDKVLNNKHIIISNLDLITEKEYEKYSEHLEEKEFIAVDFDF
ncbi:acyl transferase domain-containing protein/acyl carrier protein [Clostridium beijerinckii]|nr:acyl transferase domain-containing protein/acyl carrier protein [Clostridium beijerinckii]